MPQRVVHRLAAKVHEDPVKFWLRRLDDDTRGGHGKKYDSFVTGLVWFGPKPAEPRWCRRAILAARLH